MLMHSALLVLTAFTLTASAAFHGCDANQEAAVRAVIPVTRQYVGGAIQKLNADRGGTSGLYAAWFGEPSKARRNLVLGHFNNVNRNDFDNYDWFCGGPLCASKPKSAAYVDPPTFGRVYLCPPFWDLPPTSEHQFPSQAAVIVHEATHFKANGDTHDYAGTIDACQILALSEPDKAAMNAASHEYFAIQSVLPLAEEAESEERLVVQCA